MGLYYARDYYDGCRRASVYVRHPAMVAVMAGRSIDDKRKRK